MQAARRALILALATLLFVLTPPSWGEAAWRAALDTVPDHAPDPERLAVAGIGAQVLGMLFLRWHNAYRTRRADARADRREPSPQAEPASQ